MWRAICCLQQESLLDVSLGDMKNETDNDNENSKRNLEIQLLSDSWSTKAVSLRSDIENGDKCYVYTPRDFDRRLDAQQSIFFDDASFYRNIRNRVCVWSFVQTT